MVVDDDRPLLPWLERSLREALNLRAAHALLLHGPDGNGQFELALAIAQAFLCEAKSEATAIAPACKRCAGCRLFIARTHPDLMFLVPDSLRESLGWPAAGAEDSGVVGASTKSKPSKEIRVDDVRAVVAFAQGSSSRGMGKAVVIHPAQHMNVIAANALLKTLEEPPGLTRYILSSNAAGALLPTVRSRCLAVPVALPSQKSALAWLESEGLKDAGTMLAATGGRPVEALQWAQAGIDASLWLSVPERVMQGGAEVFVDWPLTRVIETLQKLCHDSICVAVGAEPRYFSMRGLVVSRDLSRLASWAAALRELAIHAEHPWQGTLKVESLVEQGRSALLALDADRGPQGRNSRGLASVHFAP